MRYYFCWTLLLLLPTLATAQGSNLSEGYDYLATQCKEIQCIADNLELIDQQIGALIAKRLAYVKRGAELKNTNVLVPKEAGAGYGNTVEKATAQATEMGASKGAVGSVFESIQKQSNEYEQKYLKTQEKRRLPLQ
jgi:chorismate mutase